jgi:hypothetical protein
MMRNAARERFRRLMNTSVSSSKSMRRKGSRKLMCPECTMIFTSTLVLKRMISSRKKYHRERRRKISQPKFLRC